MKRHHLLSALFFFLLAACQLQHSLQIADDEIGSENEYISDSDSDYYPDDDEDLEHCLWDYGITGYDENRKFRDMPEPALMIHAAKNGWTSVVEWLIKKDKYLVYKGCEYGFTPLEYAAMEGHTAVAALLIDAGAFVDDPSEKENGPLHHAALFGQKEVAELLIKNRAKLNDIGEDGRTPLHWAAQGGHLDVARLLLDEGALLNIGDERNITPLQIAAYNGYTEMVALLLAQGADLRSEHERGQKALQVARRNGKTITTSFLDLATNKTKDWLDRYYKAFVDKKKSEEDEEKIHNYAIDYANEIFSEKE